MNYIEATMIETAAAKNISMVHIFRTVIANDKNFISVNIACRFGITARQSHSDCRCHQSDEGPSVEDDGASFSGISTRLF